MRLLDARGLRCPWPALRLARVMRDAAAGESLTFLFDDDKAEAEVTALCAANGWSLIRQETDENRSFLISR